MSQHNNLSIWMVQYKVAQLKSERSKLAAENQVLKATVAFSTEVARPSESVKTGGLLDQDIL